MRELVALQQKFKLAMLVVSHCDAYHLQMLRNSFSLMMVVSHQLSELQGDEWNNSPLFVCAIGAGMALYARFYKPQLEGYDYSGPGVKRDSTPVPLAKAASSLFVFDLTLSMPKSAAAEQASLSNPKDISTVLPWFVAAFAKIMDKAVTINESAARTLPFFLVAQDMRQQLESIGERLALPYGPYYFPSGAAAESPKNDSDEDDDDDDNNDNDDDDDGNDDKRPNVVNDDNDDKIDDDDDDKKEKGDAGEESSSDEDRRSGGGKAKEKKRARKRAQGSKPKNRRREGENGNEEEDLDDDDDSKGKGEAPQEPDASNKKKKKGDNKYRLFY